jgi:hypothetical protein
LSFELSTMSMPRMVGSVTPSRPGAGLTISGYSPGTIACERATAAGESSTGSTRRPPTVAAASFTAAEPSAKNMTSTLPALKSLAWLTTLGVGTPSTSL